LEQGTHEELINAGGAYSKLVEAQKLREGAEGGETDSNLDDEDEKPAEKEIPLQRRNTHHSLSSQVAQQKATDMKANKEYSMVYLFSRMGRIARAQWRQYFVGSIFAISKLLFYSDKIFPLKC